MLDGSDPSERPGLYRQRTVLRTIRIPADVAEVLDTVAEEQALTFNALTNKVLRKFVEFDSFAGKLDFVTLPRETLKAILGSANPRALERAGSEMGGHVPSEISFFFYKEVGLPVFLKHLENMSRYYNLGAIEFSKSPGDTVVAIHHDLGENWSSFLSRYLTQAAKVITGIAPVCDSSAGQVWLRFKAPASELRNLAVTGRT